MNNKSRVSGSKLSIIKNTKKSPKEDLIKRAVKFYNSDQKCDTFGWYNH